MSIFSSLFSRDTEDDYELEAGQSPEKASGPSNSALTGELYEGMRIDVTDPEGMPLVIGRITALTSTTLTLERLPGGLGFKICSLESAVCASGYDRKMVPVSLRATVQESSRTVLKLKNIQVETHVEHRAAFRLPLSVPVSLYRWDDEHYKTPEECMLVDISTGGACVQSEYIHAEDEVLRIRLKLDDYTPLNFVGQIVRCVEHMPGQFRYGFLFAQLTEEEITSLNKILFNMQTGVKRTHMRTEIGHW
nr:PilZ domain-containing protein [uncultured Oscillibacter sp.]